MTLLHTTTLAQQFLSDWLYGKGGGAATAVGRDIDTTMMFIFWVSAFFFVLLMGLMVLFVIVYRRKPGVAAKRSASHNTPLELAWSVIPMVILVVLFFMGFHGYMDAVVAPAGAEEIYVKAQKWAWTLTYPNGANSPELTDPEDEEQRLKYGPEAYPIFYVPANRPVKLIMMSADVIHSFWIPDFRVKFDVFPNRYTTYWFQTDPLDTLSDKILYDEKGKFFYEEHMLMCAEYCGEKHSQMLGVIRVVDDDVYKLKLSGWSIDPNASPAVKGEIIAKTKGGCFQCHTIDGSPNTGPTWKDMFGSAGTFEDGSTIDRKDENYVRESVLTPSKRIVSGFSNKMNPYQGVLTDEEIAWITAYMKTLSVHGGSGEDNGGGEQ